MPALPLDEAGKYVAGAYLVFLALILVYVAIMAIRLATVQLPAPEPTLTERLYDEHRIEIPTMGPRRDDLLRISIAMYNDEEDVERLLDALPSVLARSARSPA